MTLSYNLASAYVAALGCDPATTPLDLRALHDTDKGDPGQARRGTLADLWPWIVERNGQGYGIFVVVSEMDGVGRKLHNVRTIRAHYTDQDAIDAQQQYEAASRWSPAPWFAVVSSPGKFHTYWPVQQYPASERFEQVQRKLRTLFNGDRAVIDATRVMRLPGTWNWKPTTLAANGGQPHLVTCHALPGYGVPVTVDALEAVLAHVVVVDGGGERTNLGDPELAAPSLAWLQRALDLVDVNDLDRGEWLAQSAAFKQAGWTLADEPTLRSMWDAWCARYEGNNPAENDKLWRSVQTTELGWPSLKRRVPGLQAMLAFGEQPASTRGAATPFTPPAPTPLPVGTVPPMPEPTPLDCSGEVLTHLECAEWFKGCTWVTRIGQVYVSDGRFLNASQFNGAFGGKQFIITGGGKLTDEPWKAALRSTLWTIPKVDHVRFLPHLPHGELVMDDLGRKGVNTFKPPLTRLVDGDVQPFLDHLARMIPDEHDRRILIEYMAHNIRFPGHKIPWAPVIQSAEGVGKGVLKAVALHAFSSSYTYFPNAKELTSSGSQFNAWMRNKLFILADEIKVDEKRDLIEVLKPMISETLIEIQSKGVDQDMEDNYANWMFFTNYKDAVPVNKNGRRYAIFYSPLQTENDLLALGMDEAYFDALYGWLRADGAAIVVNWFRNYPIERGAIKMRAPKTTSWDEAVAIGRSPMERCIIEAIEACRPGFIGGWISEIAAVKRIHEVGAVRGNVAPHVIRSIVEGMGYRDSGRQTRPHWQEDTSRMGQLYFYNGRGDPELYGAAQGYEG